MTREARSRTQSAGPAEWRSLHGCMQFTSRNRLQNQAEQSYRPQSQDQNSFTGETTGCPFDLLSLQIAASAQKLLNPPRLSPKSAVGSSFFLGTDRALTLKQLPWLLTSRRYHNSDPHGDASAGSPRQHGGMYCNIHMAAIETKQSPHKNIMWTAISKHQEQQAGAICADQPENI